MGKWTDLEDWPFTPEGRDKKLIAASIAATRRAVKQHRSVRVALGPVRQALRDARTEGVEHALTLAELALAEARRTKDASAALDRLVTVLGGIVITRRHEMKLWGGLLVK